MRLAFLRSCRADISSSTINSSHELMISEIPAGRTMLNSDSPKKDSLVWYGVEDVQQFYNEVKGYLTPLKGARPPWPHDCFRLLQTTLAILRNGLHYRFALPLLEPMRTRYGLSAASEHVVDNLYNWAVQYIKYSTAEEWKLSHPKGCLDTFPNSLFYAHSWRGPWA